MRRHLWLLLSSLAFSPASLCEEPEALRRATLSAETTDLMARVSSRVEEIRGLPFERPVSVEVVDSATARAHFEHRATRLWPEERRRLDERAYAQLGLLPAGTDILSSMLDLLAEQAWGYYDPDRDTFFVLEDVPPQTAPILMAHELTHALDDQHYGIDSLIEAAHDDDDRAMALSAVVEGSGTVVMSVFMLQEVRAGRMAKNVLEDIGASEAQRAAALMAAPPFLRRSLMAPYVLGLSFLLRGEPDRLSRSAFDPTDIDRAYSALPLSSEQILHPEKYWSDSQRDGPRVVVLPDLSSALGAGWSLASQGNLGELALAQLAGVVGPDLSSPDASAPARWTSPAAAGIAGDQYHHYAHHELSLTVLGTLWDGPDDAAEFRKSLTLDAGRRAFLDGCAVVVMGGDLGGRAETLASIVLAALPGTGRP